MKLINPRRISSSYEQEYLQEKEFIRRITKKEWLGIFPEAENYLEQDLIENFEKLEKLITLYSKGLDEMNTIKNSDLREFGIDVADCFVGDEIKKVEARIKAINQYLQIMSGAPIEGRITQDDIDRAKEYPFENLIEIKNKYALCPFHEDTHPSFYIKNNWGYCFSCGKAVDTIAFVMEIEGINFIQAVKRLK